ncbi:MAG: PQQ-binding-like beta-propeller repeat protein [Acidimicrobiia bacterium]
MRAVSSLIVALSVFVTACVGGVGDNPETDASTTSQQPGSTESTVPGDPGTPGSDSTTTVPEVPLHPWVDRRTVGEPWGDLVEGLLTFRGNPTNTWYGTGPVPRSPAITWRYPDAPMCSESTDLGTTSTWCGNGWTGQPVIWERPDGVTEMMFGAYDRKFHFVDANTGLATRTPITTGDIVKGSPTLDPDGFPLVYFGSRDNKLRIAALDRAEPEVVWDFEACLRDCPEPSDRVGLGGRWNDDWDAAPRIVNDLLLEGGENSIYYIWKLNRGYDANGSVTVDPELVFSMETWDDELMAKIQDGCTIGSRCVSTSVESSTAIFEGRAYFGTSAGRIIGLDITNVENGEAPVVFDYWVGDDVDASIVIDEEGMLYVPVEWKRYLPRARELGQLVKLDPYTDGDPYIWGMYSITEPPAQGGMWATPALGDGVIYVVTNKGFLVAVDRETGEELWVYSVGARSWSSPVIVDDTLIVAGRSGTLHAFDLADPREPQLSWTLPVGSASLLATPAVWKGSIYIASTDGYMYALADAGS